MQLIAGQDTDDSVSDRDSMEARLSLEWHCTVLCVQEMRRDETPLLESCAVGRMQQNTKFSLKVPRSPDLK